MEQMLNLIKEKMNKWINELHNKQTIEMFNSIASGKMLRSKLVLAICLDSINESKQENNISTCATLDDKSLKAIDLCAIIELIQCASLLHDDVIDDSLTRRGLPSCNATYGNKNAIMLGDILYSTAYSHLCSFGEKIAQVIADSVSALSMGELEDVSFAGEFQGDLDIYYRVIKNKTAALLASSASAAALLADKDSQKYYEYGLNLGLAFQVIDDILDATQSAEKLGKPNFNDLRENKSTIIYIDLYNNLDSALKSEFLEHFKNANSTWFKEKFIEYNTIERCQKIARDFINLALDSIKNENNSKLEKTALSMIERNF